MSVVIFTTPLHLKQCRERERVGCYGGAQKSPLSDFLGAFGSRPSRICPMCCTPATTVRGHDPDSGRGKRSGDAMAPRGSSIRSSRWTSHRTGFGRGT
jgi:hypothetical protein